MPDDEYPRDLRDLELSIHRIPMGGSWSLADLYDFPRVYSQVYSFFYVLDTPTELRSEAFSDPFIAHPWVGGYDAVNFYHQIQRGVPKAARPEIVRIRYESPGWLDLGLIVSTAIAVRIAVANFVAAGEKLNKFYTSLYEGLRDRKLTRMDLRQRQLELDREQVKFLRESSDELTRQMQFQQLVQLRALTPDDLTTLKILLAHYRRIRTLAQFKKTGKADP